MNSFAVAEGLSPEAGKVMADTAVKAFNGTGLCLTLDMEMRWDNLAIRGVMVSTDMLHIKQRKLLI